MAVRSITSDLENSIKRDQNLYGGSHCEREEGGELVSFAMRPLFKIDLILRNFKEQFANCNYLLVETGHIGDRGTPCPVTTAVFLAPNAKPAQSHRALHHD